MLIDIIAGARPNFMKVAPIIRMIESRRAAGGALRYRLVHTGQHYDRRMSSDFFTQLGIPEPDVNLEVGSGTQSEQTASIMMRYEQLLQRSPVDLCLVVGDVTSTMACAFVARKCEVRVAHVEAGLRSGDWSMPEEINRVVADSITNYFFTTSVGASANLARVGIHSDQVFFVGNTMIDTLLQHRNRFVPPEFWFDSGLQDGQYFVLTLHRPANVDDAATLQALVLATCRAATGLAVVFPVHPRTVQTLSTLGQLPDNLLTVEPQPYLEFNYLVSHAKAVITDSGGITEETTVLGIPCMTLRNSTERPETVTIGTNELLGTNPTALAPAFERLFAGRWKRGAVPERWDGEAAARIVAILEGLPLPERSAG